MAYIEPELSKIYKRHARQRKLFVKNKFRELEKILLEQGNKLALAPKAKNSALVLSAILVKNTSELVAFNAAYIADLKLMLIRHQDEIAAASQIDPGQQ